MATSRKTAEIQLLHGRVWPAIVKKASGQAHIDAAISYITIAPSFLKKGDRVACDFSIGCIRQGSTDPAAVISLIESGVEVYDQPHLHAKIIVGTGLVIVGSANASKRSGLWLKKPKYSAVTLNEAEIVVSDADGFFPTEPATKSLQAVTTGHDGIFVISAAHVKQYVATYAPQVLRLSKVTKCEGHNALNFGEAKGMTFDRVLIFPHKAGARWLSTGNFDLIAGSASKLYVGVTRARHSVTFVHDGVVSFPDLLKHEIAA